MKSVMNHRFSDQPNVNAPRSSFNRTHGIKTTFDAGYLIPVFYDFMYPGDTASLNMDGFARLATPIYPVMDNMFLETFFFAVPIRLVWSNFQKFMGERIDPGDSIDYTIPQVTINNAGEMSLADYFGIPTKVAANLDVNSIYFRAYNLIWNEWFRSQDLQDSVVVDKDDGPDTLTDYVLLRRCKKHDYFTSCLPDLQKGDAVSLPLGETAPVYGDGTNMALIGTGGGSSGVDWFLDSGDYFPGTHTTMAGGVQASTTNSWLEADLTEATAATVNEVRQAFQVQKLLERDQRSGTRYTEIVRSHFGVSSADSRLQRPEYLGGGSTPIYVNPVTQTSGSPGTGVGELGAFANSAFKGHGFTKSFTEHCIVIGLANVRADLTYQEGIDRLFTDQVRYDMYWPSFAHLGEQAVLNKEIYVDAASIGDGSIEDVFGYQERYAHMRYKKSMITGQFRSNCSTPLDSWHLSTEFGGMPTLDDTFIQDDPPIDRIIATPSEPHIKFDGLCRYLHTRPMPTYSIPGYIDHF